MVIFFGRCKVAYLLHTSTIRACQCQRKAIISLDHFALSSSVLAFYFIFVFFSSSNTY